MPDYVDVVTVCVDDVGGSKGHTVRADSPRGGDVGQTDCRQGKRLSSVSTAAYRYTSLVFLHTAVERLLYTDCDTCHSHGCHNYRNNKLAMAGA